MISFNFKSSNRFYENRQQQVLFILLYLDRDTRYHRYLYNRKQTSGAGQLKVINRRRDD